MIAWVDENCRVWGAYERWMRYGEQGWPETSVIGRLIVEGPGAGQGSYVQRVPIKDPPDAYVVVSVAIQRMAETREMENPIRVLKAHYVDQGKAKAKAPKLGMSVKQYWNMLHTAHAFIAGCSAPRETVCTLNTACA